MSGRAAFRLLEANKAAAPSTPLLLDSATPFAAFSVRKLRTAYGGSALRVQRASDSTEQDIGFTSGGDLDTTALGTFCSGTTGYVSKWYDQSGNGRDLAQTTQARMWRIYASGAVDTKNSKPSLLATDDTRGMLTAAFTASTSNIANAAAVASHPSLSATTSPRLVSAVGASNIDSTVADGIALIMRNGNTSPTQQWRLLRQSSNLLQTAVYDQLQQVYSFTSNGSAVLAVDGAQVSGTVPGGTITATNLLLSMLGTAGYASVNGLRVSEVLFSFAALDQATIRSSQKAYFATA